MPIKIDFILMRYQNNFFGGKVIYIFKNFKLFCIKKILIYKILIEILNKNLSKDLRSTYFRSVTTFDPS